MKLNVRKLVTIAVIGALYAVLTMVLAPISYGASFIPIEFRVSEVLCILPFFFPASAVGLFIGCLIANILSPFGILDVVFGSLATLLAAVCTATIGVRARRKSKVSWGSCVAACAMPVLFNAPIVGAVLAYSSAPSKFWGSFAFYIAQIGIGEAGVLFLLGLPAMRYIQKNPTFRELFSRLEQGHK